MKPFFIGLLIFGFISHLAPAQLVTFSKLPANQQLYPRNRQSMGVIPIVGKVKATGYRRVSVQVYRGASLYQYQRTQLTYANGTAPFSLTATIPAELAQFRVRVYIHSMIGDSALIADRQQLVAGDAYVIAGQSNATAYNAPPGYAYQSDYIRTFGVYTGFDAYNPADTLWASGNSSAGTLVGTWGMEMARRLTEQHGVPVCIINGAAGGAPIQVLNERNETNPQDLTTNYGRLLYRVDKAGLTGAVKAYFYRQGENETSGNAGGWPANFDLLLQNVRRDYPNLGRFYLFQIHLLAGTNEASAVFRDYQRKLSLTDPLIQSHATVGTAEYDGIHFGVEGHRQTGLELSRLVSRDFYGATDTLQITSPNVRKVYYASPAHDEVIVQFEEGQRMVWPADTTASDPYGTPVTHQLRQWVYLDKKAGEALAGWADGNRVHVRLAKRHTAKQLAYLPPNYPTQNSWEPTAPGFAQAFPGPFLRNERGLRAFTFWNVPIAEPLAQITQFTATGTPNGIRLSWNDHPAEQQYIIERKRIDQPAFTYLATQPANATSYIDSTASSQFGGPNNAMQVDAYVYRLRAVTPTAEASADLLVGFNCAAQPYPKSYQSGSWQQASTWICREPPTASVPAQVSKRHMLFLNEPTSTGQLKLNGTLRLLPGGSLRIGRVD